MSQDQVSEQADAGQISQGQILNITLLASEWKTSAGGLSTLNRELAIHLAEIQNVRVSLLVPEGACNDDDKREAGGFGINILDARKCIGMDPLHWLSNPPQDHKIDVIVGHDVKLGSQVQLIKTHIQFQDCKWVHVVHTAPEDLSKHKAYSRPISKGEKKHWDKVDLCKCADLVVPVGPRLGKLYHSYLLECKKDEDFFELIPGPFEREFGDLPAKQNPKKENDDFIVLLCGRGDEEDFELKGYDIAVKAFADQRLKGKHYSLLFVGSPEGKQDEVRERFLKGGITGEQLTVREFIKRRERMRALFCEVDMVIMPSKSEGFGLVALEALSAGLPILVGNNSGFARVIKNIPVGKCSIVADSGDPARWAAAIEDVRDRHGVVLEESKFLKECYSKKYCWKTQCEELVDRLWKIVYGASATQAIAADDLVKQCPNAVPEAVCQPNLATMQQQVEKDAVSSTRGEEGTSEDELTLPELAEHLIKLKIETVGLNEEQRKYVYDALTFQATAYMKSRNYSEVKVTGVRAFLEFLEMMYIVSLVALKVGSLIISLDCKTLSGLDQLWNDYLSGQLNKLAERHLVSDEMKKKLNLRTIKLKTTIEEENYFKCKKVLMECSGKADCTTLSSQKGRLDQGTGMTGMTTAADDDKLLPAALMANTQRGNRRFRNRHDRSWYDRSLADNVSARQTDVAMDIPKDKIGLIIGKKGWRLQEIKKLSGAHVVIIHDKVHLIGTPEQCEKAKKIIEEILDPSTHKEDYSRRIGFKLVENLLIPKELWGHVIGKCRENFNNIETKTGVTFKVCDSELYIKAESEKSEKLAVREIKALACIGVHRIQVAVPSTKFVYVDNAQLEENHEIQLVPAQVEFANTSLLGETYYKLQLLEHPLQEETFSGFRNTDSLKEEILKVLEQIYAERADQEIKVDMWSHFGHAYITKVDEDEVEETFTLKEVREKVQNANSKSWKPFFNESIEEMEIEAITSLPSLATQEDIRYDFGFYTPSCRNVRVKAWITKENSGQEGSDAGSSMVFCTTAPTPVNNILTRVKSNEDGAASNTPSFHMCYRSHQRMKVDILMPAKGLDCRLSIRTWKNYIPKSPQDEEEDKILESYLMGMKIDGDRLTLPPASQLQEGFDLHFQRRSLRKTYQYQMEGEQFSLIVCKEQAINVDPCDFDGINIGEIPAKMDIHLHCDEWDRALDEGNWEPQLIAAKVSNFLQFLRNVQRNVSPKAIRGDLTSLH